MNRAALEHQLARRLTDRDVATGDRSGSRASFSSNLLPVYFVVEVVFLTVLFTTFASIIRFVRRYLLVPPLILLTGACAMFLVVLYSPALVDADWFYQRIAVEELVAPRGPLGFSFLAVMASSLALTAISAPLQLLELLARGVGRLTGTSPIRIRAMIAGVLIAALGLQVAVERRRYQTDREEVNLSLARLQSTLDVTSVGMIRADPTMQDREVDLSESDTLLGPTRQAMNRILSSRSPEEQLRIFIPLEDGWYLYLSANPQYRYVDVRQLRHGSAAVIDYDIVEGLLRTGTQYEASFRKYLAAPYLAGRTFHAPGGRIVAVALVGPAEEYLDPSVFRWWWRLVDH